MQKGCHTVSKKTKKTKQEEEQKKKKKKSGQITKKLTIERNRIIKK